MLEHVLSTLLLLCPLLYLLDHSNQPVAFFLEYCWVLPSGISNHFELLLLIKMVVLKFLCCYRSASVTRNEDRRRPGVKMKTGEDRGIVLRFYVDLTNKLSILWYQNL